jgi:hypothetical protein
MTYFVVINEQGPAWVESRAMRDQAKWTEHAAFINSLMYSGFIIMGGPIGTPKPHRALLIVSSDAESTVRARLSQDPWMLEGILRLGSIQSWNVLVSHDKLDAVLADLAKLGPPDGHG